MKLKSREVFRAQFTARYTAAPSGCWIWVDRRDRDGYGRFSFQNRDQLAHRVVLILSGVDIPAGMEVDHLCRVRACCNPLHLDVVTKRVNGRRSYSTPGRNSRKTRCVNGHAFTPENTYVTKRGPRQGARACRTCIRAAAARYRAKRLAVTTEEQR